MFLKNIKEVKIPRTGILLVGFFSAISFSSGNDEEKRESMSKNEVTERYVKNGDGELDYREKMTFLRELVESGEITEEQARRRMGNIRRRAAESLNGEYSERQHDDREHRDRHHDGPENGDRHHDDPEHRNRHHDGHENGDRHHDGHEHRDRHRDGPEYEDRHHDDYASEIKKHFMEIEVKLLIEKYSEISKLIHQIDLDLINMEVDYETAEEEEEKKEISRLLKRKSLLWDRLKAKLHQTRDKILNLGHENEEPEVKSHHEDEKIKEYIEGLIQERRSVNARLDELFEALKQLDETDDESADAEREQIEIRIHRLESHLDKLTKELESIDK